jgi:type II secretory pathway component PulF
MMFVAAIVYSVLALQLCLGTAMIVTASIASNRQINAGSRAVDGLLRVIGRGSVALGLWGIVCTVGGTLFFRSPPSYEFVTVLGCALALAYSALILAGGWLQGRVASLLLFPPPIEEQRRREYRITLLRGIGWALALMPFGPMAGFYFLAVAVFGGTLRVQQESLLLILAVAMRTRAPLAEECEALADSSRGRFRKRLRQLANRLKRGERLSDALDAIPGLAPTQTITALRLGEQLGNVAEVASQEALRFRRREEDRLQGRFSVAGLAFYISCFAVMATAIVAFIMYWIAPKFLKIFQDFHSPVPAATRSLFDVMGVLGDYWYLIALWMVGVISGSLYVLIRRGGWTGIDWGIASAFYPRLETPAVLRGLAQTVARKHPLSVGIAALEVHHPHRAIRKRMRLLREQVTRGNNGFRPMADCGLLNSPEADALGCAERAGNLDWALEAIAENIERRQRSVLESLVETLQPAVIAGIGLLVLGVCVGIFYPVIQLMQVTM